MVQRIQIENIDELRLREGIDDVELREEIRALRAGDFVKLTLVAPTKACETLLVRITSLCADGFRGKLATQPLVSSLAELRAGAALTFAATHIHSIPRKQPNRKAGVYGSPPRKAP